MNADAILVGDATDRTDGVSNAGGARCPHRGSPHERPIYVATVMRVEGDTGVQTHVNTFIEWAQRARLPVRLVTPFQLAAAVRYPLLGIGRLVKPFNRGLWMWWYRRSRFWALRHRLMSHLERTRPAVVYAQDPLSARAALDARDSGYPIEVAMIVHFNVSHATELAEKGDIPVDGRVFREISELERDAMREVDRLIFPSQFVAQAVALSTAATRARAYCVSNFVREPARPASASPTAPHGDLISIGTLESRKNYEFLLHVVANSHALGFPCRLTIVGDGPDKHRLQKLARNLHIAEHVTFAGYVRNAATLLSRHAVYVHAARLENLPMVILEALAAGKPVCAAAVGGIPEVITDGEEGFYWKLDDPAAAARRLVRLLSDPDLYARMSLAARARHRHHFSVDVLGPRLWHAIVGCDPVEEPADDSAANPEGAS
jgi:glycosyltransferase involved in cell wall biosynthesis